MANRIIVFFPVRGITAILYVFLALFLFIVSLSYFTYLFRLIGLSHGLAFVFSSLLTIFSFLFSSVNIVIKEVQRERELVPEVDVVYVFGIPLPVTRLSIKPRKTLIAINVGGCLIPLIISILLIYFAFHNLHNTILLVIDVIILIAASKYFSKVMEGVGVVMNPLIPPIIAGVFSVLLFLHNPYLVPISAYISSVFGTLIGADLLNIRSILEANPQIVSIGGMGTFDGIFLSGLFSIIIGELLLALII
ncbi:membrane protein [Sulfolobus acidocaldarius SUSAZ]|nr:membrane protein [Sulfolobus acidocaldarius SUSAZ]